jgi:hypothetical protein
MSLARAGIARSLRAALSRFRIRLERFIAFRCEHGDSRPLGQLCIAFDTAGYNLSRCDPHTGHCSKQRQKGSRMDFDPRDYDSRDDDRFNTHRSKGSAHDPPDREDDLRLPDGDCRDRDDDARTLGRGPGDSRESTAGESDRAPRDNARWLERGRDPRDHTFYQRDVFTRDLNLPRGLEREIVRDRDHEYTLRGSETRTLATVGAFRVVSSRDLRDQYDRPLDPRRATCGTCANNDSSRPSVCRDRVSMRWR